MSSQWTNVEVYDQWWTNGEVWWSAVIPGPKTEISRRTREQPEMDSLRRIQKYPDHIWYYLSLLWLYDPYIPPAKSEVFLIHYGKLMGYLLVPFCVYRAGQYPTKFGLEGKGEGPEWLRLLRSISHPHRNFWNILDPKKRNHLQLQPWWLLA